MMDVKQLVLKITNFYSDDVGSSRDQDERRAQYISSYYLRIIYLLLFNISIYLFAFFLAYFGLTNQLQHINIFGFFGRSKHVFLAILVLGLSLAIKGIKDYILIKQTNLKIRKSISFLLDAMRFVNYLSGYYFVVWALIGNKKMPHLNHSKFMLIVMLGLFTARKIIFWTYITFFTDHTASDILFTRRKVQVEGQMDVYMRIKELNKLIKRLERQRQQLFKREKGLATFVREREESEAEEKTVFKED